jgi:hypothetical protein
MEKWYQIGIRIISVPTELYITPTKLDIIIEAKVPSNISEVITLYEIFTALSPRLAPQIEI